jgi:hypothetical protein
MPAYMLAKTILPARSLSRTKKAEARTNFIYDNFMEVGNDKHQQPPTVRHAALSGRLADAWL